MMGTRIRYSLTKVRKLTHEEVADHFKVLESNIWRRRKEEKEGKFKEQRREGHRRAAEGGRKWRLPEMKRSFSKDFKSGEL